MAWLAAPLVVVVLAAGCASQPAPTIEPSSMPTPTPVAPSQSAPVASPGTSGSASTSGLSVMLDESLLAILPATVDGATVGPEAQSFTDAITDPAFVANVQAAVFAIVVDGGDLASGVVADLRAGVYSDAFFRDWRDTYNTGACAQAGGVVGNAEAELGGRTVYIASCAGGLRVYHAYLEGRNVIVSLFSTGDRRFGELLMSGLRP